MMMADVSLPLVKPHLVSLMRTHETVWDFTRQDDANTDVNGLRMLSTSNDNVYIKDEKQDSIQDQFTEFVISADEGLPACQDTKISRDYLFDPGSLNSTSKEFTINVGIDVKEYDKNHEESQVTSTMEYQEIRAPIVVNENQEMTNTFPSNVADKIPLSHTVLPASSEPETESIHFMEGAGETDGNGVHTWNAFLIPGFQPLAEPGANHIAGTDDMVAVTFSDLPNGVIGGFLSSHSKENLNNVGVDAKEFEKNAEEFKIISPVECHEVRESTIVLMNPGMINMPPSNMEDSIIPSLNEPETDTAHCMELTGETDDNVDQPLSEFLIPGWQASGESRTNHVAGSNDAGSVTPTLDLPNSVACGIDNQGFHELSHRENEFTELGCSHLGEETQNTGALSPASKTLDMPNGIANNIYKDQVFHDFSLAVDDSFIDPRKWQGELAMLPSPVVVTEDLEGWHRFDVEESRVDGGLNQHHEPELWEQLLEDEVEERAKDNGASSLGDQGVSLLSPEQDNIGYITLGNPFVNVLNRLSSFSGGEVFVNGTFKSFPLQEESSGVFHAEGIFGGNKENASLDTSGVPLDNMFVGTEPQMDASNTKDLDGQGQWSSDMQTEQNHQPLSDQSKNASELDVHQLLKTDQNDGSSGVFQTEEGICGGKKENASSDTSGVPLDSMFVGSEPQMDASNIKDLDGEGQCSSDVQTEQNHQPLTDQSKNTRELDVDQHLKTDHNDELMADKLAQAAESFEHPSFMSLVNPVSHAVVEASMPTYYQTKNAVPKQEEIWVANFDLTVPPTQIITRSSSLPQIEMGAAPVEGSYSGNVEIHSPAASTKMRASLMSPRLSPVVKNVVDKVHAMSDTGNDVLATIEKCPGPNAENDVAKPKSFWGYCLCH